MKTKTDPPGHGWYAVEGLQAGQVDFEDRIDGLEFIARRAEGKTVYDLGCAEGLIAQWLVTRGALGAIGFDYNKSRVDMGNAITCPSVNLYVLDLEEIAEKGFKETKPCADIVLCLAILQKMRRPEKLLDMAMALCGEWLVIRTPSQVIDDKRSDHRKLDTKAYICERGFEWMYMKFKPVHVGIYRRCS